MNNPLILVGGGGHCKSVIDVAESAGYTILGILDKPDEVGKMVLGYEVIGVDDDIPLYVDKAEFIITVGFIKDPTIRIKLYNKVLNAGGKFATLIASTAHVSKYATIGTGTVIMHQAVVNACAVVGDNVIVNTFANIGHDVSVGNYCHISTGAMICGNAVIADETFVGSQSVINQGVHFAGGIIASLSVLTKSTTERGIYAGSPAKLINTL